MAYDGYQCLKIRLDCGVAFVTIDHPPIKATTGDRRRMEKFMELGGQTREIELGLNGLLEKMRE